MMCWLARHGGGGAQPASQLCGPKPSTAACLGPGRASQVWASPAWALAEQVKCGPRDVLGFITLVNGACPTRIKTVWTLIGIAIAIGTPMDIAAYISPGLDKDLVS